MLISDENGWAYDWPRTKITIKNIIEDFLGILAAI